MRPSFGFFLICALAACGAKKEAGPAAQAPSAADAALAAPAVDAAPPAPDAGPVAAPGPVFCGEGKECPCKPEKDPWHMMTCELPEPLMVQGVPCGAGRIAFFEDGHLAECTITAPTMVGPYLCAQGLKLFENGSLDRCHVRGKYTVDGIELEADRGYQSFDFELYEDGKLRWGEVARPTRFGDKTCRGSVTLYRSGAPYDCKITEPMPAGELTLPAGTPALFAEDGTLIGFFPQQDITWKGKKVGAGNPVCLKKDCNGLPDK